MQLSDSFTLEELSRTDTGLPNIPGELEREKLLYLAAFILQPLRNKWGALKVTSGYRCQAVNRHVGGTATSQHVKGEAVDFIPVEIVPALPQKMPTSAQRLDLIFAWLVKESGLRFGQCIRESKSGSDWIHISLPRLVGNNQEALLFDGKSYKWYRGEP